MIATRTMIGMASVACAVAALSAGAGEAKAQCYSGGYGGYYYSSPVYVAPAPVVVAPPPVVYSAPVYCAPRVVYPSYRSGFSFGFGYSSGPRYYGGHRHYGHHRSHRSVGFGYHR